MTKQEFNSLYGVRINEEAYQLLQIINGNCDNCIIDYNIKKSINVLLKENANLLKELQEKEIIIKFLNTKLDSKKQKEENNKGYKILYKQFKDKYKSIAIKYKNVIDIMKQNKYPEEIFAELFTYLRKDIESEE